MFDIEFVYEKPFLDKSVVEQLSLKALHAVHQNEEVVFPFDKSKKLKFTLCFAGDEEVKALNQQFRGKDKPTNVLSFPSGEDMPGMEMVLDTTEKYIGDMVMSVDTLVFEANAQNKSLSDHFVHLLVHSVLHLLGYDHIIETEALEMERLEIDILKALGVNNPYHKN